MVLLEPYWQLDGSKLYQGHVLDVLDAMEAQSVHMAATSPPYWGLRDYGLPPVEWPAVSYAPMAGLPEIDVPGCAEGCEHVWGEKQTVRSENWEHGPNAMNDSSNGARNPRKDGAIKKVEISQGQYCQLCGGWRGCLGLEPTVEMFVGHLVLVWRALWRVLRDDGCCFLNLGDSYFSSGQSVSSGTSPKSTLTGGGGKYREGSKAEAMWLASGARRGVVCDTHGKAPASYPDRDCLSESLCDVCHVAYRHKSHKDSLLSAMLVASLSETSQAYREFEHVHSPTLDYLHQMSRILNAIPDLVRSQGRAGEPFCAFRASMPAEFYRLLLDVCLQRANDGECLICGRSLVACAQKCGHSSASPCESLTTSLDMPGRYENTRDTSLTDGALACHNEGTVSDSCSYPHSTITPITSQLKPKDLIGVPWRVAFALQADGWYLRSDVIWAKGVSFCPTYSGSCMPESVRDRPTNSFEHVFLLSKNKRYFYDGDAVREAHFDKHRPNGWKGQDGISTSNHYKNQGWGESGLVTPNREYNPAGRNLRTVWTINPGSYAGAHFATFPTALVEPMIKAGTSAKGCCPECGKPWERVTDVSYTDGGAGGGTGMSGDASGLTRIMPERKTKHTMTTGWRPTCTCDAGEPVPCTVLDPFTGSGTVPDVARQLGRKWVGIELSKEYCDNHIIPRLSEPLFEWAEQEQERKPEPEQLELL